MKKEIEVVIDEKGDFEVGAHGYGKNCAKATAALEALLGQKVSDRRTPEFYLKATQSEKAKVRS